MNMKQIGLGASGFVRRPKWTRKQIFLQEKESVAPWAEPVALIELHAPPHDLKGGRLPFVIETMLRIHLLQQWVNLSDPAAEDALHDVPLFRDLDIGIAQQLLAKITHLLEVKGLLLRTGTAVDAIIVAAPSLTKNKQGKWDSQMRQTKRAKQVVFRNENVHWRGCRLGAGARGGGHSGQCTRCHAGAPPAARKRERCTRRLRLSWRSQAAANNIRTLRCQLTRGYDGPQASGAEQER